MTGDAIRTAGVAAAAFALFALTSLQGFPNGIALVGAERVLEGGVPYRDFWTMYAPGQFYLLAGLFALFGTHTLVSSLAGTLLSASAVGLGYRLVARLTGRRAYALAASVLFVTVFLNAGYFASVTSYTPVVFCVLLALNMFERHLARGGDRVLVGAGLAVGVGALFKHDVGGYTGVAILAGLLVFRLLPGEGRAQRNPLRDPLIFGIAAAIPVLPVIAALAVVAGYDAFWDTIWFPATIFGDVRGNAYPSLLPTGLYHPWKVQHLLNWCQYVYFALPTLIWLTSLPATAVAAWRRQTRTAALGTTFAVAFLFHYLAAQVQINTHIISMTVYAICLGALMLPASISRRGEARIPGARALAAVVAAGWFVTLAAQPAFKLPVVQRALGLPPQIRTALPLPMASNAKLLRDRTESLAALAEYVHRRVPPGRPIYVGVRRHDVLIISMPHLYFLLERPPATRYQELHSGVVDTAPVQAEIIRDLKDRNVRLIVLADPFRDDVLDRIKRLKRQKQPQVGATELDGFIRANFVQTERFGEFSVWLRKPARARRTAR